jgi:hypothetical protein
MAQNDTAWAKRIKNLTPGELFREAQKKFAPKSGAASVPEQPAYLPNPSDAAPTLVLLALSGKGFADLHFTATDFLFAARRSIHRRDRAVGHVIIAYDGSEVDARRNLQDALTRPQAFLPALRAAIAESALSSCDIGALRGVIGARSDAPEKIVEDRLLDRIAAGFERAYGPMRRFAVKPRQSGAVPQG